MLTLGSLFDGIGGWLLAAQHVGIKPLWRCEIDEYPRAVSEYHFPDVDSYGDIRNIHGDKIAPVDIVCAGSPCQNLSVAGNRKGLQGSESSLFYESIRILREMRGATNGKYPRFFVWENVTGAFNSNHGNDFRAVLSEIGQTKIPMPESGRWGGVRNGQSSAL
ncbi:MAG: DNA cytosine methyltransferase [Selenomonas bovis]